MATQSVQKDIQGPDWPLGLIAVAAAGTPVGIMSLVDPNSYNSPNTASSVNTAEYTVRAYGILFVACKAGASHGLQANTGNIYICRKGVQGAGNRDDYGSIVTFLPPGSSTVPSSFFLLAAPLNRDVFSPYRYYIDADNNGDSCLVTLVMQ